MNSDVLTEDDLKQKLRESFRSGGIALDRQEIRFYPDEVQANLYVSDTVYVRAIEVSASIDAGTLSSKPVLVVVRRLAPPATTASGRLKTVDDHRVTDLVQLIASRNRVSLAQPSLSYVANAVANLGLVTSARHHLVFGRRGAGKSALLVEARRVLESGGSVVAWTNLQSLRREEPYRILLRVIDDALAATVAEVQRRHSTSAIAVRLSQLTELVQRTLGDEKATAKSVERIVPDVQIALRRALELLDCSLYMFIDDFYYVPRSSQADLLDLLHGMTRDSNIWLKIASIRHLTRWFQASPPLGLQTGHDADIVDLDVSLQDAARAKAFLQNVLQGYANHVGIGRITWLFREEALDRLVLASGGVPRDYLVLARAAVVRAQSRAKARIVGVQDVNEAAGDAAQAKLQELEEDLAANIGGAERTLRVLSTVREFCLERTGHEPFTYFRVDFRDKEAQAVEYASLADLMDVRLVHLIDGSLSDGQKAGRRYEVFMLDLSQYSGKRLRHGTRVLELVGDHFVSRTTRVKDSSPRVGDTARNLNAILRGGPIFDLGLLRDA